MMFFVQCVFFVLCNTVWCNAREETTEVHGDVTGPGPAGNMFEEVFKYAYKNYYKNNPNGKVNSRERPKIFSKDFAKRQQHQYNPPPCTATTSSSSIHLSSTLLHAPACTPYTSLSCLSLSTTTLLSSTTLRISISTDERKVSRENHAEPVGIVSTIETQVRNNKPR